MTLQTFDNADYNRAAGFLESVGLPVDLLAPPPPEVDWILQKRRNDDHVWTSGQWSARICKTTEGRQLVADLKLAGDDVMRLDSVTLEPEQIPHGMTFESFETDMLARFAAWIAKHGNEALDDQLLSFKLARKHSNALLDSTEDYLKQALADQDLDLAAAVMALKSALLRGFE